MKGMQCLPKRSKANSRGNCLSLPLYYASPN